MLCFPYSKNPKLGEGERLRAHLGAEGSGTGTHGVQDPGLAQPGCCCGCQLHGSCPGGSQCSHIHHQCSSNAAKILHLRFRMHLCRPTPLFLSTFPPNSRHNCLPPLRFPLRRVGVKACGQGVKRVLVHRHCNSFANCTNYPQGPIWLHLFGMNCSLRCNLES